MVGLGLSAPNHTDLYQVFAGMEPVFFSILTPAWCQSDNSVDHKFNISGFDSTGETLHPWPMRRWPCDYVNVMVHPYALVRGRRVSPPGSHCHPAGDLCSSPLPTRSAQQTDARCGISKCAASMFWKTGRRPGPVPGPSRNPQGGRQHEVEPVSRSHRRLNSASP